MPRAGTEDNRDNRKLMTRREGSVCTLVLNSPRKKNVLTPGLLAEFSGKMRELSQDHTIRVVVIRGAGDEAFCSGYDISALGRDTPPGSTGPPPGQNPFGPFEETVESIVNFPYPVIAMLNGYAFGGGCDLAISCDLRVGADHIRMGMTPARIGMVYTPAGLRRFIRAIGLSRTKELFFTGRTYDARQAREMGLVDYLVPRAELETFTYGLAREIAQNAPLSLRGIKRIVNLVLQQESMDQGAGDEALKILNRVLESHDLREGRTAFLEKRKPVFQGR